ncbi:DUF2949 domain-containing protein [Gloeobacter kilaueensis]|uniref:Uncharacterized protein n=1 Tax=Gloeobacter kilaueensis (strain ATCC BAA-2537 / CCAP 1431/1 / ULC 316 / JS1) TaxID=1183438 RepID=U5QDV8_GLOK1|nr:DUF2949 domain-containing protein [Gloeobacter kilaueensis]AGY57101.1 hypothetical protein GKIL_0855 [Gloeobacter kilaueensis JS1]
METSAAENYLLASKLITEAQLARVRELAQLWQGTLPIVLWKLGLIDLDTFALLIEL